MFHETTESRREEWFVACADGTDAFSPVLR